MVQKGGKIPRGVKTPIEHDSQPTLSGERIHGDARQWDTAPERRCRVGKNPLRSGVKTPI